MPEQSVRGRAGKIDTGDVEYLVNVAFGHLTRAGCREITAGDIHTLLYLARKSLPKKSALLQKLVYCWWQYPESIMVSRALHNMEAKGELVRSDCILTYSNSSDKKPPLDGADVECMSKTMAVHAVSDLDALVCRNAPSEFYTKYWFGFEFGILDLCNSVNAGGDYNEIRKKVLDLLIDAMLEIPHGDVAFEFRKIFYRYFQALCRLLKTDDLIEDEKYWYTQALYLCGDVWNAFVSLAPILWHDPYYEGHVTGWKKDHLKDLKNMRDDLDRFWTFADGLSLPEEPLSKKCQELVDRTVQNPTPKHETYQIDEYLRIIDSYTGNGRK